MIRKFFIAFATLSLVSLKLAAAPELNANHPDRYTVVKGDTLWDISERFLTSPWLWPEVWHVNPQISNPHLIFPGDVIGLIYVDGQPRITTLKEGPNNGVVKLSPKVRAAPISTAIPTIPLDAISSFLSENRIVTLEELEAAPYVLSGKEAHLITGAGDEIFARGDAKGADKLGIYRQSERYTDPDSGEFLGLEAKAIASTAVSAQDDDIVTLRVLRSSEEVRQGDRLLVSEDRELNSTFTPSKPKKGLQGKMIAVDSGVNNIGQYNVVTVNLGEREGVEVGNVFAVYKSGGTTLDPYTNERLELPAQRAGLMMVFRTFDKLSYGLILKAQRPLAVLDEVRVP